MGARKGCWVSSGVLAASPPPVKAGLEARGGALTRREQLQVPSGARPGPGWGAGGACTLQPGGFSATILQRWAPATWLRVWRSWVPEGDESQADGGGGPNPGQGMTGRATWGRGPHQRRPSPDCPVERRLPRVRPRLVPLSCTCTGGGRPWTMCRRGHGLSAQESCVGVDAISDAPDTSRVTVLSPQRAPSRRVRDNSLWMLKGLNWTPERILRTSEKGIPQHSSLAPSSGAGLRSSMFPVSETHSLVKRCCD